jgi:hypothetical protein
MPQKKSKSKKLSAFRLSLAKVTTKQVIIIVLLVSCFISIPFIVDYLQSPEKVSLQESISTTFENLKFKYEETDQPFMIKLPIINTEINLTVFKQNPQLITYIGLGFVTISLIMGITLLRNMRK